jgi:hypothetical protein
MHLMKNFLKVFKLNLLTERRSKNFRLAAFFNYLGSLTFIRILFLQHNQILMIELIFEDLNESVQGMLPTGDLLLNE